MFQDMAPMDAHSAFQQWGSFGWGRKAPASIAKNNQHLQLHVLRLHFVGRAEMHLLLGLLCTRPFHSGRPKRRSPTFNLNEHQHEHDSWLICCTVHFLVHTKDLKVFCPAEAISNFTEFLLYGSERLQLLQPYLLFCVAAKLHIVQ